MKIKKPTNRQTGSALLVALGIALVLSITLGSYLYLVGTGRGLAARSQSWNSAIPVAEAGVEEALTQLHYTGTNNLTTNGWTQGGDGMYHKNRVLPDGSKYGTAIQLTAKYPIIWSTGCVSAPFAGTNAYISRLLKIDTFKAPSFGGGITAKGTIGFSGGAFLDSFDSSDPNYSNPDGSYNPAKASDHATAVSDSNLAKAISLSGGYIAGTAATGPSGTVSLSGSAKIGDSAFVNGSFSGAETGHVSNDANLQIDSVTAPAWYSDGSSYHSSIPSGTVNGTNYSAIVGTGNYAVSTISISSSAAPMLVNGNATVYVTYAGNNAVVVSGSGYIYIAPGASLTLITAGNMTISGSGVVNGNQNASSCTIYGLPTCTTMTYSGSAVFYGVVDTPDADFTFSGGSGAAGSFTAKTVTISGSAGVHYDMGLAGKRGYIVSGWNEMPLH